VRDKDVEAEIGKLCERFAAFEDLPDGLVRKDGFATVGIDVFFEGEKVENLSRPAYLYDLSQPPAFPDLKKSLAGKKVGESFEVKGSFPKDFPDAAKAGKDAVFAVAVQQARQRVIPEFNDELAARVEAGKTAAGLREEIRRSMDERAVQHVQNKIREQIGEYLIEKAKDVELPESMLRGEIDSLLRDFARRLAYMRVTLDDYLAQSGETLDKIREAYRPAAEKQLRLMLMLNEVIREEKITASDEETGQALQDLAQRAGKNLDELLGSLDDDAIEGVRFDISRAKAWEALLAAARVKAGKSHSYADLVAELEKKES
jgi:trigger factor